MSTGIHPRRRPRRCSAGAALEQQRSPRRTGRSPTHNAAATGLVRSSRTAMAANDSAQPNTIARAAGSPGGQRPGASAVHHLVDVAVEVRVHGVGAGGGQRPAEQRAERDPQVRQSWAASNMAGTVVTRRSSMIRAWWGRRRRRWCHPNPGSTAGPFEGASTARPPWLTRIDRHRFSLPASCRLQGQSSRPPRTLWVKAAAMPLGRRPPPDASRLPGLQRGCMGRPWLLVRAPNRISGVTSLHNLRSRTAGMS